MQPTNTKAATRRLRVDPSLCEAHALCTELSPDIFELGDDIASCEPDVDETHWDSVEAAISACPRQAIGWVSA